MAEGQGGEPTPDRSRKPRAPRANKTAAKVPATRPSGAPPVAGLPSFPPDLDVRTKEAEAEMAHRHLRDMAKSDHENAEAAKRSSQEHEIATKKLAHDQRLQIVIACTVCAAVVTVMVALAIFIARSPSVEDRRNAQAAVVAICLALISFAAGRAVGSKA